MAVQICSGAVAPHLGVLVVDACSGRAARVGGLVRTAGAEVLRAVPKGPPGPFALGALVGLRGDEEDRAPRPGEAALKVIDLCRSRGVPVACYEDGIDSWAIAARCRVLIAGSHVLLDSAGPTFCAEVGGHLGRILGRTQLRKADGGRTRARLEALGFVGSSPSMIRVFDQIARLGPLSDLPTLVTGETGTGKELVARSLHAFDGVRCAAPLVAINCSALNPALVESELFGHRRGAFTGAERERKGVIRAANGGVLFLDEIGELALETQAKLLRVLQEGRVLSVGDDAETAVDVRVVAATHRDLRRMVNDGTFREDLFHRLSVLTIHVPPLRERREDIRPLVDLFLHRMESPGDTARAPTSEFIEALERLPLPGNVRQLENIVRQSVAHADHAGDLRLSDLPAEVWGEILRAHEGEGADADQVGKRAHVAFAGPRDHDVWLEPGFTLAGVLSRCERGVLEAALVRTGGNRERTAQLLGLNVRSVYNKLRKHRLGCS